jgi:hypothetical protein
MSSWRQQALIEAPVEKIWELVGDPNRHPEWWPRVLEVSGVPVITQDASYRQVTRSRSGVVETTFNVEELDELKTIKLRCVDTDTYAHFLLTDVRGSTFVDFELGMDPVPDRFADFDRTRGKQYFREWGQEAIDGLKLAAESPRAATEPAR